MKEKRPLIFRNYIRWPLVFAMIFTVLLGLLYGFFIDPVASSDVTLKCVTYEMTGLYCPGCGETRALHALLHGHIIQAFDYNLLFPFVVIIMGWLFLVGLTTLICRKRVMWLPETFPAWLGIVIGVVVVLFTVLRNIPVWPFSILAP
ncbi:MAG: DUF2752 domain-containing protein [Clostridiales bacterium]|nr:DUF2752 domain-containing protein [Clostridiales bacterium]